MEDLKKQEIFEMEALEQLKKGRMLEPLIFVGGTMLRLCHELSRYSVDLDFWIIKKIDYGAYFRKITECLEKSWKITDAQNKFNTILVELKSDKFPRKLKIEIRKKTGECSHEHKIAFSKFSDRQVLVKSATLEQMMKNKTEAFLDRKEIRDCFDMEFLLRKGTGLPGKKENLLKMAEIIHKFRPVDYSVSLGSLLEPEMRKYYVKSNFTFLLDKIREL